MSSQDPSELASALQQNPHALRKAKHNQLEVAIGKQIRALRKEQGITGAELAATAGISLGMLSKIENGSTSASLTTLQQLSIALVTPIASFFYGFEQDREAVFVPAGEGIEIERRGSRAGHQYRLLGHVISKNDSVVVEPYLLTLSDVSDEFPLFQHSGVEFIYMLEGEMKYLHNSKTYHLKAGDSLFFDSDAPHGPEELTTFPIRFLSIISYDCQNRLSNQS